MILAHSYTGQEVAPVSLAHFSRSFNSKVYYVLPGGHKINPQVRDRMHWNLCFQLLLSANKTEAQHHLLQTHTGTLSQATCQIHSVTHTTGSLVRVGVLGWERIWQEHLTRMVSQNITVRVCPFQWIDGSYVVWFEQNPAEIFAYKRQGSDNIRNVHAIDHKKRVELMHVLLACDLFYLILGRKLMIHWGS